MQKLPEEVKSNGTTMRLIKRESFKALYISMEDIYEVFRVLVKPATVLFDKEYPEREVFPGMEAFGVTAWSTKSLIRAEEIYNNLKPKPRKNEVETKTV